MPFCSVRGASRVRVRRRSTLDRAFRQRVALLIHSGSYRISRRAATYRPDLADPVTSKGRFRTTESLARELAVPTHEPSDGTRSDDAKAVSRVLVACREALLELKEDAAHPPFLGTASRTMRTMLAFSLDLLQASPSAHAAFGSRCARRRRLNLARRRDNSIVHMSHL